ncbi:MAG: helix-turn-helix domain-containing protein [Candidatus Glassbacteria bacterium]|nr:helix-turn-helix domain-containing protein [Candidatus Glassbacteria bacterium]
MKTYSTGEVARLVGIGRATLHRWMRERKVPVPRVRRVACVTVRFWSKSDLEKVRTYKAAHYCKGRGRKKKIKP